jgi:hypothetical protein
LPDPLTSVEAFVTRDDDGDSIRRCAPGTFWLDHRELAVNEYFLAIATSGSRSSINGRLKLLGYTIGSRGHTLCDQLTHTFPFFEGDGREPRGWTIRKAGLPSGSVVPSKPKQDLSI